MKRYRLLLTGILLCVTFPIFAQQITHRVGRGETVVTIAEKYGVSIAELIELNPSLKNGAHFGAEIKIPTPKQEAAAPGQTRKSVASQSQTSRPGVSSSSQSVQDPTELFNSYIAQAEKAFSKKQYGKAKRLYEKADILIPSPAARYNIGLCHYKLENWRKARKAFHDVRFDRKYSASDELKSQAKDMFYASDSQLQKRRAQRQETWAAIGAGVAMAGAAVATGYVASQAAASAYAAPAPSSVSVSSSGSPAYDRAMMELNMINARYVSQVETFKQANQEIMPVWMTWSSSYHQPGEDWDRSFSDMFYEQKNRYPNAAEMEAFHGMLMAEAEMYNQNQGNASYGIDSQDQTGQTTASTGNYEADYRRYESLVIGAFKSWTAIGGTSTKDSNGTTRITVDSSNPGGSNLSMKAQILRSQKEMHRIREEAARNGVHITQSEWEYKDVSFY